MNGRRSWTDCSAGLIFLLIVDTVAIFDAFALGYLCRFQWGFILPALSYAATPAEYAKAWVLGLYVILALFHAYGLYGRRRFRTPVESLVPIARAGAIAVLFILALSYFYRAFSFSRVSFVYSCAFALLLVGGFRISWEAYRRTLRQRGVGVTPVIMVGSRTIPQFLARRLEEEPGFGFRIVAVVDEVEIDSDCFTALPRGRLRDLPRLLEVSGAREVLVGHPAVSHHDLLEMIDVCERREVRIRMVPATYDLLIDVTDIDEIEGIPLVTVNERRPRRSFRAVKRAVDIATSASLLVLLSPLMVVSALLVRLDSPGPAIFRQRRIGQHGSPFTMLKFRTMVRDAEGRLDELVDLDALAEPVFKLAHDPRVTRIGRFLRRFSIDELPQLINVLRGDMSLVGPRPEEEKVVALYDIWERRRLKLKPGITGLQQLHCRGGSSLKERVRWDIVYLRKESALLDLWIMVRTVGAVLGGEGAR